MPADVTPEEVWRLFRETDRQIQKTDRQIQALVASGAQVDETVKRLAETVAANSTDIVRVSRNVDALTGKWGRFIEGIVAPACETLFAERGIPVHRVYQRARSRHGGRTMEIDLLVVDTGYVVLVGVKSTLKVEDVRDHMTRLDEFKTFFPEDADRRILRRRRRDRHRGGCRPVRLSRRPVRDRTSRRHGAAAERRRIRAEGVVMGPGKPALAALATPA